MQNDVTLVLTCAPIPLASVRIRAAIQIRPCLEQHAPIPTVDLAVCCLTFRAGPCSSIMKPARLKSRKETQAAAQLNKPTHKRAAALRQLWPDR